MRSVRSGLAAPVIFVAACASSPMTGLSAEEVAAMQFVDAAGVRTHVQAWGAETSPPIILIHGASSDMGLWAPTVLPRLKDSYRLVAYDRPGMGFTAQRPADADELAVQARVAAGVIEAMGLERPIVLAHSFGGAVALRLALDRPDLVSGLVLAAPVAFEWPGGVAWHTYISSNPLVGPLFNHVLAPAFAPAAAREGVTGTFAPAPAPQNYVEEASVLRAIRPAAMAASARDLVAAKREIIAQQPRYPELTLPVAIISGDGDTVVSTTIHSVELNSVLPLSRLEILKGVGHMPHEAAPDLLADLVAWVGANRPQAR